MGVGEWESNAFDVNFLCQLGAAKNTLLACQRSDKSTVDRQELLNAQGLNALNVTFQLTFVLHFQLRGTSNALLDNLSPRSIKGHKVLIAS